MFRRYNKAEVHSEACLKVHSAQGPIPTFSALLAVEELRKFDTRSVEAFLAEISEKRPACLEELVIE